MIKMVLPKFQNLPCVRNLIDWIRQQTSALLHMQVVRVAWGGSLWICQVARLVDVETGSTPRYGKHIGEVYTWCCAVYIHVHTHIRHMHIFLYTHIISYHIIYHIPYTIYHIPYTIYIIYCILYFMYHVQYVHQIL